MMPDFDRLDRMDRTLAGSRRQVVREQPPQSCGFTVLVDSREQAPWRFTAIAGRDGAPLIVPVQMDVTLRTGDYSIDGLQDRLAIERKSVGDFRSSITADRERFEREMERMAEMRYAAVVIEGDLAEIMDVPGGSLFSPTTAARTIQSWSIKYRVHFFPMPGRRVAEVWAFRLLQFGWKYLMADGLEAKTTEQQDESRNLILNLD